MEKTQLVLILVGSAGGAIAEVISLLFPDALLELIENGPKEQAKGELTPFQKFSGVLSLFYMATIALLLFSGDPKFRVYALLLVGLSLIVWVGRKWLPHFRYVMMAESTVCLVILLDIGRSVLRMMGVHGL